MIKSVQFKDENTRLHVNGLGFIDNKNITPQKAQIIIDLNPSHADLFEIVTDEEQTKVSKSKPSKDDLQA